MREDRNAKNAWLAITKTQLALIRVNHAIWEPTKRRRVRAPVSNVPILQSPLLWEVVNLQIAFAKLDTQERIKNVTCAWLANTETLPWVARRASRVLLASTLQQNNPRVQLVRQNPNPTLMPRVVSVLQAITKRQPYQSRSAKNVL